MAQWGTRRIFGRGTIRVNMIPHVATENFAPINDYSIIDELHLFSQPFGGKPEDIARLILDLQARFEKQAYHLWLTESFPEQEHMLTAIRALIPCAQIAKELLETVDKTAEAERIANVIMKVRPYAS